jgi:hypothetical protein
MDEKAKKPARRQPSATDCAFGAASVPVHATLGGGSIVPGVLLAVFTLGYVFVFLPLAFVFKWVASMRNAKP